MAQTKVYWSVSKLTAGCATHRAHCQASDRRLHSPLASPRPRHSKITKSDASYIPGQQNLQTQLHRTTPYHCRQHAHAGSRNELKRLALHAQSSLPQCSREFRNVITPPRKISYVITRQDACHKLTFLRKGDQYFVTLNDRPWQ